MAATPDVGIRAQVKFELNNTRRVWEHFRPVLLALGLDELVREYEQLIVDGAERVLSEPDTYEQECAALTNRIAAAAGAAVGQGGQLPYELGDWLRFRGETLAARAERNKQLLDSEMGRDYCCFLRAARRRTPESVMHGMARASPPLRVGASDDLRRAMETESLEVRMRGLARAVLELAERLYKPQLRMVWELLLEMGAARPRRAPRTLGEHVAACRRAWDGDGSLPSLRGFLDEAALEIRNAAAHTEWLSFDPMTGELVVSWPRRDEKRYTEQDLRAVAASLFHRCHVMHLAIGEETGWRPDERSLLTIADLGGRSE